MTNDERIDDLIRNAASDYNRPPETPRDEMWAAIQAASGAVATGPRLHVSDGGGLAGSAAHAGRNNHQAARSSAPKYTWMSLAAAAALLVATGVGIGRWTSSGRDPVERRVADAPAQSEPVAASGGIVAPDARSESAPPPAPPVSPEVSGGTRTTPASRPAPVRTRDQIRRDPVITGNGGLRPLLAANQQQSNQANGFQEASYRVATQEHLRDTEALLTSFSLESPDERMNSRFAGWAKGLLSNTRLLLDSPAGDDPRRARLLQDLEMVLAQIVQLSPDAPVAEREMVQGSIQNGLMMTRLRSAIPADQPGEITER